DTSHRASSSVPMVAVDRLWLSSTPLRARTHRVETLVSLPPVRTLWSQTRSQPLRMNHLVDRRVMRKGVCIPELNKFWGVKSCLKSTDSLPLCHINKAEPGVGHKTPMEPSRNIAGLPLHEGFGGFPLCQKRLVLAFGHFKGIDEHHRWHRYAPSHP